MSRTKHCFANYSELSHTFTHSGANDYGYSNSHRMHFDGNKVFSYASQIGVKFPNEKVLLLNDYYRGYSNTTTNQMYALKDAFSHWTIIEVEGDHTTLQGAQKKCKELLLKYLKYPDIIKKYNCPRQKVIRTAISRVYTAYNQLQIVTKRDIFTELQHNAVNYVVECCKKYEEVLKDAANKRYATINAERIRREKLQEQVNNEAWKRYKELGKDLFDKLDKTNTIGEIMHAFDVADNLYYDQIKKEMYDKYEVEPWIDQSYKRLEMAKIKGVYDWLVEHEKPYTLDNYREDLLTRTYGDELSVYDYIGFDTDGSIKTNRWATIPAKMVKGVVTLAKYYLSNHTLEEKVNHLHGKHCGSYEIGRITDEFIRVGCHLFTKPMVQCFVDDYNKLYGGKNG